MLELGGDEELRLIPLRRELRLYQAAAEDGIPGWTLEDPVRNQYFRLGRQQVEQIARWESGTATALCERLKLEAGLVTNVEDVAQFQRFLLANSLLDPAASEVQNFLAYRQAQGKGHWFMRATQSYIFFRIPLWHPDRFLEKTLPYVRPLASRFAAGLYLLLLISALVFLTPQWSAFFSSFPYFFSWQGATAYMVVIFIVKLFHELGHAYTAKAYGLRVPVTGVALIVLWPMLYSDNTDAWKQKEAKVRMKIVLAGIGTEMVLAIVATFLWTILQPGLVRSLCFVLATTSWISSVLINISPFMRFDGYYLLSDYLGVPNLAQRSFALGRWRLRHILWGMDAPKPEYFSPRMEKILTLYCYGTWLYRLLLLNGIALMVYHLFFKALGVFLFGVEIYVFILKPIGSEMIQWWKNRQLIGCNGHVLVTTLVMLSLLGLLFIPLPVPIVIPALLVAEDSSAVFVPFPAQLEQIRVQNGQAVEQGDVLFTLSSQHIVAQQQIVTMEIASLTAQLQREMVSKKMVEQTAVTETQLTAALLRAQGLADQQRKLRIVSPLSGRVAGVADGIQVGSWIGFARPLCHIVSAPGQRVVGYLVEDDLPLLPENLTGYFRAESGDLPAVACTLTILDHGNQTTLSFPELASLYGGDIAVAGGQDAGLRPLQTRYRIEFKTLTPVASATSVRGHVVIKGQRLSLLGRFWRSLAPGIIREGEF